MDISKKRTLFRYLAYAKPYRLAIIVVIVAGVAKFTLPLIPAKVSRVVIDRIILNSAGESQADRLALLWTLAALLAGVTLLEGVAIYLRGLYNVHLSSGIAFDLRQDLWKHVQRLHLGFHRSRPSGAILSRLMNDIASAQQMINGGILHVFIDGISGTVALVMLLTISWQLTLLVLAVLPFYGLVYRRLNPRIRQAAEEVQEQTSVMSGTAVERLGGIAIVQSFAQENAEARHFASQGEQLRDRSVRRGKLANLLNAVSNMLVAAATAVVLIVGGWMAVRGHLSPGRILEFLMVSAQLYLPIRRFSEINIIYQTSMAAIDRVFAIFDVTPQVQQRPDLPDRVPGMGGIEFDNVAFRYAPDREPVLRGLSFSVAPGERVAIVGESGAGKSTLVTLIPRLYDVTDGAIRIDGIDVRDYRLRQLRRSIGIVLQDPILFSGTVAENLRYGRKGATDAEILDAAKAANAHEFIREMPQGYDTLIGERGLSLSGGQRQRLSLARTILQNPRILILDEATSSLDSESENLITEALQRVMAGRTSLIIAHRLSTIMGADRILVLKEGQLVEQGPHADLLRGDGHYQGLFLQQIQPLQRLLDQVAQVE